MTKYTTETNEIRALRRGMSLMPRWHAIPDARKLWDDLLVKSGVGEWVQYADMQKHYDVVVAIVLRTQKRALEAEQRAERLVESYTKMKREYDEYQSLCQEQASTIRQLQARIVRENGGGPSKSPPL